MCIFCDYFRVIGVFFFVVEIWSREGFYFGEVELKDRFGFCFFLSVGGVGEGSG